MFVDVKFTFEFLQNIVSNILRSFRMLGFELCHGQTLANRTKPGPCFLIGIYANL